jgi:hypothetical protein
MPRAISTIQKNNTQRHNAEKKKKTRKLPSLKLREEHKQMAEHATELYKVIVLQGEANDLATKTTSFLSYRYICTWSADTAHRVKPCRLGTTSSRQDPIQRG